MAKAKQPIKTWYQWHIPTESIREMRRRVRPPGWYGSEAFVLEDRIMEVKACIAWAEREERALCAQLRAIKKGRK